MLRQAWSQVRLHPGRFVSTILAVAISVAFLAGSAVMVATEARAEGRALNVPLANADLVVEGVESAKAGAVIAGTDGVAAASPVLSWTEPVTAGESSVLVSFGNVPADQLRWSQLADGRWPQAADEVVLSQGAVSALSAKTGDRVTGSIADISLIVVGVTNEPSSLFTKTGYAGEAFFAERGMDTSVSYSWTVKAEPGTDLAELSERLATALASSGTEITVRPAEEVRTEAVDQLAGNFAVFTNLLWAFAVVALVVGMITIANTFSITLAQRRREIGLLRAVGASGAQVRRRFFAEAIILGLIGSLVGLVTGTGLAAGGSAYTGALFWGLELPAVQLGIAAALGVLATVGAAWLPIVRGTRVLPLEALQPVLTVEEQRRASTVRAVVCGLLLLGGGVLTALALAGTQWSFFAAILAGALISLGVLFGAPLFVPSLLRLTGVLVARFGITSRLAAKNAERNPRRATATAAALMLAVGLIVTLQVGTASIRHTMLAEIERDTPVDISVVWHTDEGLAPLPKETLTQLGAAPGVAGMVTLPALNAEVGPADNRYGVTVFGFSPAVPTVTGLDVGIGANEIALDAEIISSLGKPDQLEVVGDRTLRLKPVASKLVDSSQAMVAADTLAKLGTPVAGAAVWLSVPDRDRAVDAMVAVTKAVGQQGAVGGSIAMAANIEQVLNIVLAITTALLAVAVLIALIGVSNTLGLSVLERTRESALLRALGLQARSLRAMLTIEALQVTLVGVLVGVVAGTFFGWLAVTSLGGTMKLTDIRFSVDVPQTLAMVSLAVVAAALASVLPGRRAAKAAPTEALADI